jgi:hypothetical protein
MSANKSAGGCTTWDTRASSPHSHNFYIFGHDMLAERKNKMEDEAKLGDSE